ncbi:hypothetical protein C5167_049740 [Papaver somniferum]|uniref:HVA22-like protein n=1 Tax=Papaver somniferum TaxID=3469 RepID=A0A4Y7KQ58_PAPSO|nr:putative HVA22-like protein g [Papaver somniferum]RZC74261.1 hypothetical protein C5167_049740 [Papaver somniferum]
MMGSFLTRGLIMAFGYAYPAYECYKVVEKNKPEIEQLRFWCQYWILVAMLTIFERLADIFVSWVPMYCEAKFALFIYLWYPKTKGATYVYDSFFRPYIAQHEKEIDRNLLELKTSAGDLAIVYGQKAVAYGQTRFFEIMHYIASQTTSRPRLSQQQQAIDVHEPPPYVRPRAPATPAAQQPSRTSSTGAAEHQQEPAQETDPKSPTPSVPAAFHPLDALFSRDTNDMEAETSKNQPVPSAATYENSNETQQDIFMDEAIQETRARLRNTGIRQ